MLKLAAEPYDSPTVLDWDFVLYAKVMCCKCGKHEPSLKVFKVDRHLLQAAFYYVVLDKTIFVSRKKPSVYLLIHLHSNEPLEKTTAFKAVPGRRDLPGAYLREIFPFPPEISNFMDF